MDTPIYSFSINILSVISTLLKSIIPNNTNNIIYIRKVGYFINIKSIITYKGLICYANSYLLNINIASISKFKPFYYLSPIPIYLIAKLY